MKWLLLVEDHALFREGLALLLKWRTGLDNVQSASIAEARHILGNAEEEPVCAVVDLDLPWRCPRCAVSQQSRRTGHYLIPFAI